MLVCCSFHTNLSLLFHDVAAPFVFVLLIPLHNPCATTHFMQMPKSCIHLALVQPIVFFLTTVLHLLKIPIGLALVVALFLCQCYCSSCVCATVVPLVSMVSPPLLALCKLKLQAPNFEN
jgi:hypothetical protein